MDCYFKNILIVGIGVMGGSFLKKLQDFNCSIYCIEKDEDIIKKALLENSNFQIVKIDDEIIKKMDLVILTLFPSEIPNYFNTLNNLVSKSTLVFEISGIKNSFSHKLQNNYNFNFLLTHPMAGRESGGYDYSDATIFKNANFIIINDVLKISLNLKNEFNKFIQDLGFSNIFEMNCKNHDQAITYTSQLSHVLALSLLKSKDYSFETKDTIGDSFRNLTRIAKLNIPLWSTLFLENSFLLEKSIDNLIIELEEIKSYIKNSDKENLEEYLSISKKRRMEIEGDLNGN